MLIKKNIPLKNAEYIYPQKISFVKTGNNKVTVCASTNKKQYQNGIVNNINLTLIISSPFKDIIRVQTYHHSGEADSSPSFNINSGTSDLQTTETDNFLTITSGSLSLEINKYHFSMKYLRNDTTLTESQFSSLSLVKNTSYNDIYHYNTSKNAYIRQQLSINVDELIYGLGESFVSIIKNGQIINYPNNDFETKENAARTIPFYLSNKGYGLFVNHPQKIYFDICNNTFDKSEFITEGSYLDYYIINGFSMKEVLEKYNKLTCNHQSQTSDVMSLSAYFGSNDSNENIIDFIKKIHYANIPLTSIIFDNTYNNSISWYNLLDNTEESYNFFDTIKQIKNCGSKAIITISPYISQYSLLFEECKEKDYFIKTPDGNIFQIDMVETGMALLDFTNPNVYKWYQEKLEILIDMGIDSFNINFINQLPDYIIYYNNSVPTMTTYQYLVLYNNCINEIISQNNIQPIFSSNININNRNSQFNLIHNKCTSYEEMAKTIRNNLSLSMSGYVSLTNVFNIYEDHFSPDVLKRWIAFCLLSSSVVIGNNNSFFTSNQEILDVLSFFSMHRTQLMPYLYQNAITASNTGIPYIRSMIMEFNDDKNCLYLDKQYMLGDNILISPILNNQNNAEYYLPAGIWTNYFTGKEYKGGTWINEEHSFLSIPFMIRENSVIVTTCSKTNNIYNNHESEYELRVYAIHNGVKINTKIYAPDKSIEFSTSIKRNGHNIFIAVNGIKPFKIRMINMHADNAINGFITIDGNDSIITPDINSNIIEINF